MCLQAIKQDRTVALAWHSTNISTYTRYVQGHHVKMALRLDRIKMQLRCRSILDACLRSQSSLSVSLTALKAS